MSAIRAVVKKVQRGSGGRPALIGKTEMTSFAKDDMIQEGDAKEVGTFSEPDREEMVFLTGRRITGRMVMGTETGSGIHENERLKDFARMDDRQGQGTDRDDIDANNTVFGVESADEELLSVQPFEAGPEQVCGGKRGLNGFG